MLIKKELKRKNKMKNKLLFLNKRKKIFISFYRVKSDLTVYK